MPTAPTPTINYRIPPDNPYVGATTFNGLPVNSNNVRTEFYAVGLRNPWRFSFDPVTHLLYLADVGQTSREEVNIIYKGGNYGWAYREGFIARPGAPTPPAGFTHINPIQDYIQEPSASITGGIVYHGSRIPALDGAYIFADYISGMIWQMRYEVTGGVTNIVPFSPILTNTGIACFGVDPSNQDALLGNVNNGRILRLMPVGGGYAVSNAFGPTLTFTAPVALVTPPGETNRLFVVEQSGRIAVITNLANPNRTVFMDIANRVRFNQEQGLLGLAFHPGYATNRHFYVFYVGNTNGVQTSDNSSRHDILSRFETSPTDPNAGLANSEMILIRQLDEASNHNAGDLHFGPDGYLYVTLGDEGGGNDQFNNSQNITKDFFAGMLRIDVDNRPGSLMPNPHPANTIGTPVVIPPATLADTGIFSDVDALTPNAGIIPYDVSMPYWTDGAIKRRWFCIPDIASRITMRTAQSWTFPVGMVWVQHFDLEMTNGVPASRRPIETRVLVRDTTTTPGHYGVTYRWNSPSNAVLVAADGEEEVFAIDENGTTRMQAWRYPSRADCLMCHNLQAGRALGFNAPQLNRNFDYAAYAGVVDNQIRALTNAGYGNFTPAIASLHTLPVMAALDDESFGVQHRTRSYLMANCAHCHYPAGPGLGNFNARIYVASSAQGIIDGTLQNNLGDPLNRVIRSGSVTNSVMHTRMASDVEGFRMPLLGSLLPDQQALQVLRDWIQDLTNYLTFTAWQTNHFGATNIPNALATADPDGDGARNQLEYFTGTDPNNASDAWNIGIQQAGTGVSIVYTQKPNYGFEVQWTPHLTNASGWRPLSVDENRPNFSGQEKIRSVPDTTGSAPMKAYRVRVFEP
jgi:glucose/arabinose dehydrogenase